MRRQPRSGKRHVLRWVAVAGLLIVVAGTLTAYLKYRAVYDSITHITVPSTPSVTARRCTAPTR